MPQTLFSARFGRQVFACSPGSPRSFPRGLPDFLHPEFLLLIQAVAALPKLGQCAL
jgi:hypothetical protein